MADVRNCNAIYVIYIYPYARDQFTGDGPVTSHRRGLLERDAKQVPLSPAREKFGNINRCRAHGSLSRTHRIIAFATITHSLAPFRRERCVHRACAKETLLPWLRNPASGSDKTSFYSNQSRANDVYEQIRKSFRKIYNRYFAHLEEVYFPLVIFQQDFNNFFLFIPRRKDYICEEYFIYHKFRSIGYDIRKMWIRKNKKEGKSIG